MCAVLLMMMMVMVITTVEALLSKQVLLWLVADEVVVVQRCSRIAHWKCSPYNNVWMCAFDYSTYLTYLIHSVQLQHSSPFAKCLTEAEKNESKWRYKWISSSTRRRWHTTWRPLAQKLLFPCLPSAAAALIVSLVDWTDWLRRPERPFA